MLYKIDRFEGDYAVLEDEDMLTKSVHRSLIDSDAKEGSSLRFDGKSYACVLGNDDARRIKSKFDRLKKGSN